MSDKPVVGPRWRGLVASTLGVVMLAALVVPRSAEAKAPVLKPQSTLSSLSSASGTRARCDALLRWLESGSAPGGRSAAGLLDVFRDEHMLAVFGRVYDQDGGAWHREAYESAMAPCLGLRPPPRGLFGRLFAPEPPDPEQVRQLSRYAGVLRQAFDGQRGPADAMQIGRFLADARHQLERANALMAQADDTAADLASLTQLRARAAEARGYTRLSAADRQLVQQHVAQREAELLPAIVQDWLAQARATPPSTQAALQLARDHWQLRRSLGALPPQLASELDREVQQLVDAGIAPELQAEQERLRAIAPTREGAQALTDWEREVLGRYAELKSPTLDQAVRGLDEARTRVLSALLPAWKAQVAALGSGADVAARHAELTALFGAGGERLAALRQEFRAPLEERRAQIEARVAEDERARLAQAQRASATAATSTGPGRPVVLSASDLAVTAVNGAVVRSLFRGSFEDITAAPGSTEISALASGYMQQFWRQCPKHIADPVELTRQECAAETVTRNGYGMEISRSCSSYRTVGTGVYAERSLVRASSSRGMDQMGASMRSMMDMMKGGNPLAMAANMVNVVKAYSEAGADAVASNACDGAALERFRVNLENFLTGKPGVQLDGSRSMGVAMLPPAPGETYRDSNYVRLLEDLVGDASRSWAFNRYLAGSIQRAQVTERDAAGRPAKVEAGYRFQGMRGNEGGTVSLDFVEGRPRCLYFSDMPGACRALNPRLLADYVNGKYR
jgi:hypothetical protein